MVRTCGLKNYSDIHFTDREIAKRIVDFFKPNLPCLEPLAGDGAFLSALPDGTEWCEIQKGVDFILFLRYKPLPFKVGLSRTDR